MQETQIQSLGQEDPLEEKTATGSSILTWEIPWWKEPGGLQSVLGVAESDVTEHDTRNSILGPNREAPDNLVSEVFTPKV